MTGYHHGACVWEWSAAFYQCRKEALGDQAAASSNQFYCTYKEEPGRKPCNCQHTCSVVDLVNSDRSLDFCELLIGTVRDSSFNFCVKSTHDPTYMCVCVLVWTIVLTTKNNITFCLHWTNMLRFERDRCWTIWQTFANNKWHARTNVSHGSRAL